MNAVDDLFKQYEKASRQIMVFVFALLAVILFIAAGVCYFHVPDMTSALLSNGRERAGLPDRLYLLCFFFMFCAWVCRMYSIHKTSRFFKSLSFEQMNKLLHSGNIQGDDAQLLVEAMNKAHSKNKK